MAYSGSISSVDYNLTEVDTPRAKSSPLLLVPFHSISFSPGCSAMSSTRTWTGRSVDVINHDVDFGFSSKCKPDLCAVHEWVRHVNRLVYSIAGAPAFPTEKLNVWTVVFASLPSLSKCALSDTSSCTEYSPTQL